jgi:hypothetical protein
MARKLEPRHFGNPGLYLPLAAKPPRRSELTLVYPRWSGVHRTAAEVTRHMLAHPWQKLLDAALGRDWALLRRQGPRELRRVWRDARRRWPAIEAATWRRWCGRGGMSMSSPH